MLLSKFDLSYGQGKVQIDTAGAKTLEVLNVTQRPALENLALAFNHAVESESIGTPPLNQKLSSGDQVTVIISDITRSWMRQNLICPLLVDYLSGTIGIPLENITFLVALGTHRFQTEKELRSLVSDQVFEKVSVVNHDCKSPSLVNVGRTSQGNDVFVNPLITGGRKVIVISATSHHIMSGYSGGRKSILPGVSGIDTILRNHINSLDPELPKSNPQIGMGEMGNNPVHDDMSEAADMVSPHFGINIALNASGEICRLMAGDFKLAWEESCKDCQESMGVEITERADMAVVSCGGFPKDMNLYQSCKSFFNAVRAVKDDGEIVFLAACPEGGGTAEFFDWIKPLREGRLDAALRENFSIDGYIFFAFCEAMAKRRVHFLTDIPPQELDGIPLDAYNDAKALLENVSFKEKSVYVLPYAGNTVPFLKNF